MESFFEITLSCTSVTLHLLFAYYFPVFPDFKPSFRNASCYFYFECRLFIHTKFTIIELVDCFRDRYGVQSMASLSNKFGTVAVWNFMTRKSRNLPCAPIKCKNWKKYEDTHIYGFGYGKTTNDYKVVRIIVRKNINGLEIDNEVRVYCLESHTSHRVQKFPKCPYLKRTAGVFVEGCLHWLTDVQYEDIVTFDLDKEVFDFLEQQVYTQRGFKKSLHSLRGCLKISLSFTLLNYVNIWAMKEYGVKESWTKWLSISITTSQVRWFYYMHPIAYPKNGRELLLELNDHEFVWYDIKKKTMRFVQVAG